MTDDAGLSRLADARACLALALHAGATPEEALQILDSGLADARSTSNETAIALLAKNAGLVSFHNGRLEAAVEYYREALEHSPQDGYLLFATGDVYRQLGRSSEAARCFDLCREEATRTQDQDLFSLLGGVNG